MSKGLFVIKPYKAAQAPEKDYEKKIWAILERAVNQIYDKNSSELSYEELYRHEYNLVLQKHGMFLYRELQNCITSHLAAVAEKVFASRDSLLMTLNGQWVEHQTNMRMIRDIFLYMDRTFVGQHHLPSVYNMGMIAFRDAVIHQAKVKERLVAMVLDEIDLERRGEVIERSVLRNITKMWVDLGIDGKGVYEATFEEPFLAKSTEFYQRESQQYIGQCSCPEYLRRAESRLTEELARVDHYLDYITTNKIRKVVETAMLETHLKLLIEMDTGLVAMLRDEKLEDLARMYRLLGPIPGGLALVKQVLCEYIFQTGTDLVVKDEEKSKQSGPFVEALLEFKAKADRLLEGGFSKAGKADHEFVTAVNETFTRFINQNAKAPEFVASYLDEKLKTGTKGITELEMEALFDHVLVLFRFLNDKDIFENFYKQQLAKRLLLKRTSSDELERIMIGKLKQECGYSFTSKLDGMFTDMKVSDDQMDEFKQYLEGAETPVRVDLHVSILTQGYWPNQIMAKCNMPPEIDTAIQTFQSWYLGKHSGRRLTWQPNLGTADLKARFRGKLYELNVSTYQMVILMLFNDRDTLTFREILQMTDMPDKDLRRGLGSLALQKVKVLLKEPDNKEIGDADVFRFNAEFSNPHRRVKISTFITHKDKVDPVETRTKVDEDRKHLIEATVVRIMKARQHMDHQNLVSEVIKSLYSRFQPAPKAIMQRIESLIERDYLERDKTDRRLFHYLA